MSLNPKADIAIVDYGAGNLTSVVKALAHLGASAAVTSDPDVVRRASKVVLPGVGHFAATSSLADRGLTAAIQESSRRGAPFLGICVGLQWLFSGSSEAPETSGAGLLSGRCDRFTGGGKIPHVGWNSLSMLKNSRLMAGVAEGTFVYYTHSYRASPQEDTVAVTDYGGPFAAAVECGNIMGVQFHPEKSATAGLRILQNFLEF